MNWLVFALIGTASFAATGILDKFILSRYIENSAAYLVSLIIIQQLFALLIFIFKGAEFVYPASAIALFAGSFQVVLLVSYLRALQVEEVSRVMPLVFIYPLFVFAFASLFLRETLTLGKYNGALMLVLSAILISYKPAKSKASVILSPAVKYLFFFIDEWQLYFWSSLGNLLFCMPILGIRRIRMETLGILKKRTHSAWCNTTGGNL